MRHSRHNSAPPRRPTAGYSPSESRTEPSASLLQLVPLQRENPTVNNGEQAACLQSRSEAHCTTARSCPPVHTPPEPLHLQDTPGLSSFLPGSPGSVQVYINNSHTIHNRQQCFYAPFACLKQHICAKKPAQVVLLYSSLISPSQLWATKTH